MKLVVVVVVVVVMEFVWRIWEKKNIKIL